MPAQATTTFTNVWPMVGPLVGVVLGALLTPFITSRWQRRQGIRQTNRRLCASVRAHQVAS